MANIIKSHYYELTAPRELILREKIIDLENLDSDAVVGKTIFSTVSPGTELAAYRGDPPLRPGPIYPRVNGYCNVAEVIAVGSGVTDYSVGDSILTGESHRSAFVTSARNIMAKIPKGSDLKLASTTYLFHLGYNAVLKGNIRPGYNVGVVGLGTLGFTTAAVAKLSGARVFGFSDQKNLTAVAKKFGITRTFAKSEEQLAGKLLGATSGVGLDLVISTSNSWADWETTLSITRRGGTICLLGFPGRGQKNPEFNPLDSRHVYDNQLTIIACGYTPDLDVPTIDLRFTRKRNCQFLLESINNGELPAERLISFTKKWTELRDVYTSLLDRGESTLTGTLEW